MRRTANTTNYARSISFVGPTSGDDYNSTTTWSLDNGSDGTKMYVERSSGHDQGTAPAVGTTYLAEVIFNGSTCTTYIDGTLQGTAFASSGNFNINKMAIGAAAVGSAWFTGDIAEVVLYNSALSATDRQGDRELSEAEMGASRPEPTACPSADRPSGSTPRQARAYSTAAARKPATARLSQRGAIWLAGRPER